MMDLEPETNLEAVKRILYGVRTIRGNFSLNQPSVEIVLMAEILSELRKKSRAADPHQDCLSANDPAKLPDDSWSWKSEADRVAKRLFGTFIRPVFSIDVLIEEFQRFYDRGWFEKEKIHLGKVSSDQEGRGSKKSPEPYGGRLAIWQCTNKPFRTLTGEALTPEECGIKRSLGLVNPESIGIGQLMEMWCERCRKMTSHKFLEVLPAACWPGL